ncbi:MAG TPA: ParB/RepB/Spo0J family partition protein [Tenuifilaceae bacterium]|jgi:ParB family chromosome partitioning protein|nr:ParB/RepB/Spo0J family partition protein [Bacteroidales bacterium]HNT40655.1 ParB/RepB/Spo0J family partition protein [Tenuifilaceae bacterium]MBP8643110.1 ParB/RepB/Spo0J family partition protein [Bacteroidales bacterium]NLI87562.1 ParB/RepB/Spo0J family partition protein [Bacteroidales bacterium]HNY08994.1 ParB/RepB/Spo0J family partition protein [Tenuifilaceae bacterium]
MTKKMALGRGLGALIEDSTFESTRNSDVQTPRHAISELVQEVDIELIDPNPFQPRTNFDDESLSELAESISKLGIIQPITVRLLDGRYQLISGERRFRAAKLAGLKTLPAFIRTADDQGMLEMSLVENIQREDLNAIEVAISYQRLIDECSLTQDALSERVGKKRATISNYLRLLKLPAEIQLGIINSIISMGHARALISIDDASLQLKLYKKVISDDLSVRQTEELVRNTVSEPQIKQSRSKVMPDLAGPELALREHLTNRLGLRADVKPGGKGDGKIVISYNNPDELSVIIDKFTKIEE